MCTQGRGRGLGGYSPPIIFQMYIFGGKKQVKFGLNHLIYGEAMENIFGQENSAPLPSNESGPVRLQQLTITLTKIILVVNTGVNPGGMGVYNTSPTFEGGGWPVQIYLPLFKET